MQRAESILADIDNRRELRTYLSFNLVVHSVCDVAQHKKVREHGGLACNHLEKLT